MQPYIFQCSNPKKYQVGGGGEVGVKNSGRPKWIVPSTSKIRYQGADEIGVCVSHTKYKCTAFWI